MMGYAIFFVESPLQYINALEAREYYGINSSESVLFLFEGVSKNNLSQLKNSSQEDEWFDKVVIRKNQHSILRYLAKYKCDNYITKLTIKIRHVFIGEYRSDLMRHLIHKIKPKYATLLDDGNVTPEIYAKISRKNRIDISVKRRIVNWLFQLDDSDIFDIDYFSLYKLGDLLPRNNFKRLQESIGNKERSNEIYFLGNNTVEMSIISMNNYIDSLKMVRNYYDSATVIYFPHRREDKNKLQVLTELGWQVKFIDLPFELFLSRQPFLPLEIASFVTSALDNCNKIFAGRIPVTSFYIEPEHFRERDRQTFIDCYLGYSEKNSGIKLIDLSQFKGAEMDN